MDFQLDRDSLQQEVGRLREQRLLQEIEQLLEDNLSDADIETRAELEAIAQLIEELAKGELTRAA